MIIAVFNQAGGAGKTTMVHNIGHALAKKHKQKVLLVDLDGQASLSLFEGLAEQGYSSPLYEVLVNKASLADDDIVSVNGVDLVPADGMLSLAAMELPTLPDWEQRLQIALAPMRRRYDFILIDCPPSLGPLSTMALVAADRVLVPVECEEKCFQGTDRLLNTIVNIKTSGLNPDLGIQGFVPTRFKSNRAHHQRVLAQLQQLGDIAKIYEPIPDSIAFVDASEQRLPLADYKSSHKALGAIHALAKDIFKSIPKG